MLDFTSHFQFAHPSWLWLLPVFLLLMLLRKRHGAEGSIALPTVKFVAHLAKKPTSLAGRIGAILLVLSGLFLIIALARPQLVDEKTHKVVNGVDIMIAFDLSGSMDTPDMILQGLRADRMTAAKYVICHFIDKRPDDRIGVIGFAGRTKSFCPLTLDHALTSAVIQRFTKDSISADGTAIGSAIAAAATRLDIRKESKSKVIILITDGASNSGQISPIEAATAAAKLGIKVYTIAVGTEDDPDDNAYGISGQNFDEPTLKKIAALTGGEHFRATDTNKLLLAFSSIDQLEKSEAKLFTLRKERDLFIYFLSASALLSLLGLCINIARPVPAP
jgi:Ca-activated chloride channel family protein